MSIIICSGGLLSLMTGLHPASCINPWTIQHSALLLLTSGCEIITEMWYSLNKTSKFSPTLGYFIVILCMVVMVWLWFLENILGKPLVRFYHVKLGNYKHLIVEERSAAPSCIEILQIGVWSEARGRTLNTPSSVTSPTIKKRGGGGLKEKYVQHIASSSGQHQYGRLKISCCTRNVCSLKIRIFAYLHFESLYQMLLIFSA